MSVIAQEKLTSNLTQFLINLTKLKGNCMTKLASLTIIQEFLKNDKNKNVRQLFIEFGLIDSLLITLDDGLEDQSDQAFLDVSMKCLWTLSHLPIGPLQVLINSGTIKRLVDFLDTSSSAFLYKSDFALKVKALCEKKHLVGQVKETPMTSDLFNSIQKLSNGKLKLLQNLPDCLKCCQLYDTSDSDKDVDLSELLISEGKAWSSVEIETEDSLKNGEEMWVDIFITEVIDGPLFWGHVGITVIENVRRIQACLASHHASGDLQPIKCDVGDMVSVYTQLNDDSLFYVRASVIVTGLRRIKAWSLDYGFLMDLPNSQVFMLPTELQTTVYPPQVSLCTLAGLQAPARNPILTRLSASILTNLCRKSIPACETLKSLGGLDHIQRFLEVCPDYVTMEYIFNLINNFACHNKLSDCIAETSITEVVLDKVIELSTLQEHLNPLLAGLGCLCNLLYRNEFTRDRFYQHDGIQSIIKILMMHGQMKGDVYKLSIRVLKTFIQGHRKFPSNVHQSKESREKSRRRNIYHRPAALRNCPVEFAKLLEDHAKKEETKSAATTSKDQVGAIMSQARHHEDAWSSDDSADENLHENYKTSAALSATVNSGEDVEEELLMRQNRSKISGSPPVAKDTAEYYCNTSERIYVLNAEVNIINDTTHELRPNKSIEKVSSTIIAKHVCGMLNSGKSGSIFFGLQATVIGIKLTRDDRDEFRLGVDRMMSSKLSPCVLHSMFDVLYHQVMEKDDRGTLTPAKDIFVAEITIKPNHGTFYNLTEGRCFYRFGAHTSQLTAQEMRQLIILEDEEMYREEIQDLRQELEELKQQCEGKI